MNSVLILPSQFAIFPHHEQDSTRLPMSHTDMKMTRKSAIEISADTIDIFCKNVFNLRSISTRTFEAERFSPACDVLSSCIEDMHDDPPQVVTRSSTHIQWLEWDPHKSHRLSSHSQHLLIFLLSIFITAIDSYLLVSRSPFCRPIPGSALSTSRLRGPSGRSDISFFKHSPHANDGYNPFYTHHSLNLFWCFTFSWMRTLMTCGQYFSS